MMSHFGLRVTRARRDQNPRFWRFGVLGRSGVMLCILLVLLTGFVAAAHFHPNDSGADHSCSLCALAHTGIVVTSVSQPLPVFTRSVLPEGSTPTQHFLLLVFSQYIRPPPQS
jgi:hypothetical protein